MATNKGSGPMSKDAVSGGKQFQIQDKEAINTATTSFSNSSSAIESAIKKLRIASTGFSNNMEAGIKKAKPVN